MRSFFLITQCTLLIASLVSAEVRVKDVAKVAGARDVELIGYGLVIGLDGTGDKPGTYPTIGSLANMLRKMGVSVAQADLNASNVAAVMVTARAPAFSSAGSTLDATVSSLGTATSLKSGTLMLTALQSIDGTVVGSAQGKVMVERSGPESKSKDRTKVATTVGFVPSGVLIENDIATPMAGNPSVIEIALNQPDYVTADRLASVIEKSLGVTCERKSAGRLQVQVPVESQNDPVAFAARLEVLTFEPDQASRVVINEQTGTVMAGQNVRLLPVTISHGRLKIEVGESGSGKKGSLLMMPEGATVTTLVAMLNGIGIAPSDIAMIFKTLQRVGALKADVVVM